MSNLACENCGKKYDRNFEQNEDFAPEVTCPACGHEFEVDIGVQDETFLNVKDDD